MLFFVIISVITAAGHTNQETLKLSHTYLAAATVRKVSNFERHAPCLWDCNAVNTRGDHVFTITALRP